MVCDDLRSPLRRETCWSFGGWAEFHECVRMGWEAGNSGKTTNKDVYNIASVTQGWASRRQHEK